MGEKTRKRVSSILVNAVLFFLVLLWTVPTFGLLVSSFRSREDVLSSGWWTVFTNPGETELTLNNYRQVLGGSQTTIVENGREVTVSGGDMGTAFLNSLAVAVPSTVIPLLIAAFAAYAFAWMDFPGRRLFFIIVVALLVVPLQVALIPICATIAG